ncbi:type II toxin-antitoxin system CcdA family antitoxin [Staphylothermus hellenicus]|uniref:Transcriptional regulator, CopG family n=1 Tax=Staphylothermus hellenicus (strain DSM 12710 / JCM 10830 / BK20S6-10-b1 / P8) TaxID=591019 RepID=D7D8C8_STAHD|nr:type II toxin-antitoxin system CcdA family antitoxin [Staphylothermus hellenicus]ADI32024.1 hypothetical protein Shell_0916 [Staphylothermus hellenicus DSM 12710]
MYTSVISIRIPRRVKEELKRLGINYSNEVREYLIKRVREERGKRLIEEIDKLMKSIGLVEDNLSARFTREDRDRDWSVALR